jgi:hypothetical protein
MKSFHWLILAFATFIGTSVVQAAEELDSGTSESGKIAWKVVDKGEGKVLISEGDQGESAATVLTTTVAAGNTKVFVSPDDFWIIVESGTGSLGFYLQVFQRQKGLNYKLMEDMDLGEPVIRAAFKAAGKEAAADTLDHTYVRLLAWSADSGTVLVQVRGRGGKLQFGPYVVAYDLGKKTFSNDLAKFNAKAIRP